MDVHFGSSSYLSKFLKNKKVSITSGDNKNIYDELNINFLKYTNFEYIFIFIGKNLKNKNNKKSKKINYLIPLKILKKLVNLKKKIKIIFFGSFSEFDFNKKNKDKNTDYINHKIKLRNEINKLQYKLPKKIEFVWLCLPNIYGPNQPNNFLISWIINSVKKNKKITILNDHKKIYLLNVFDFVRTINCIKKNWLNYKNKILFSQYEGPYDLINLVSLIQKRYSSNFCRYRISKKIDENIIKANIKLKIKYLFSSFLNNKKKNFNPLIKQH